MMLKSGKIVRSISMGNLDLMGGGREREAPTNDDSRSEQGEVRQANPSPESLHRYVSPPPRGSDAFQGPSVRVGVRTGREDGNPGQGNAQGDAPQASGTDDARAERGRDQVYHPLRIPYPKPQVIRSQAEIPRIGENQGFQASDRGVSRPNTHPGHEYDQPSYCQQSRRESHPSRHEDWEWFGQGPPSSTHSGWGWSYPNPSYGYPFPPTMPDDSLYGGMYGGYYYPPPPRPYQCLPPPRPFEHIPPPVTPNEVSSQVVLQTVTEKQIPSASFRRYPIPLEPFDGKRPIEDFLAASSVRSTSEAFLDRHQGQDDQWQPELPFNGRPPDDPWHPKLPYHGRPPDDVSCRSVASPSGMGIHHLSESLCTTRPPDLH